MEKSSVNNLLYACIEKFYKNTGIRYFMMSISCCIVCGVVLYIILTLFWFAF